MTGTVDIQELNGRARWLKDYGVKTMICDPDTLLALIEAVKRQGEALEKIARHDNTGITGPGRQQADSCVQIARASLKEATDV